MIPGSKNRPLASIASSAGSLHRGVERHDFVPVNQHRRLNFFGWQHNGCVFYKCLHDFSFDGPDSSVEYKGQQFQSGLEFFPAIAILGTQNAQGI